VTHVPELLSTSTTTTTSEAADEFCSGPLSSAINNALMISFVEVVNCMLGCTKSPLMAVLLFSCTRMGVEKWVASQIPCRSWQHLLTVSCWAAGDTIRFGSLAAVTADPTLTIAKSIRFSVGPVLFPIGAGGEMLMVILAASSNDRPMLYVAAALWPVFFYPMMVQLLKQRRKHFQSNKDKKKVIKSV
jgi:Protein tyrosine phosphatase-like protein, PTPLA